VIDASRIEERWGKVIRARYSLRIKMVLEIVYMY
jgi:hypothetical protein